MIDTEKYKGHTPAPWEYNTDDDGWTLAAIRERDDPDRDEFIVLITKPEGNPHLTMNPDLELMADAPLLLAEVKKLQDKITLMEMQYVGLEQAYYDSPAETENKQLRGLLDAIYWDAFSEDDTTLEINREVAERVRRVIE